MSQENVEIVKAAFEAYTRGDADWMVGAADPEIVWHSLPESPDPGPHEGRQVVLERSVMWREMFGLQVEVLEYIEVGEYVFAPVRVRGRAPGSDAELVLPSESPPAPERGVPVGWPNTTRLKEHGYVRQRHTPRLRSGGVHEG
jgi:SnoaL-like protein